MEALLSSLNSAQRAAVCSPEDAVLQILAGPGSGKTKALTARVVYLIQHYGLQPENIIVATFTVKAANEMKSRIAKIVANGQESRIVLGTFHSIARRYLLKYGRRIGVESPFGIADTGDTVAIIKGIIKKSQYDINPSVMRSRISYHKATGTCTKMSPETRDIFLEYQETLEKQNLLDYDDLLIKCVELLKAYPNCVNNVQHMLVDEYQDTNSIQYELLTLMAWKRSHITVVGDPDQSIYAFRAADIANLSRMSKSYNVSVVRLEENYRSSASVLNAALCLIEQDVARPAKTLLSTHDVGTTPTLRKLPDVNHEASWIAREVKRLFGFTGGLLNASDVAVLVRSAYLTRPIEMAFTREGLAYKVVGGHRFLDREEIRTLVDYLRVVYRPVDASALLRIINVPKRGLGEKTLGKFGEEAKKLNLSVWDVVNRAADGRIAIGNPSKIKDFVGFIQKMRAFSEAEDDVPRLLDAILEGIQFKSFLSEKFGELREERWQNVLELRAQAADIKLEEEPLPSPSATDDEPVVLSALGNFLGHIALSSDISKENEKESKAHITISTIHAAKGLEWPVVFVPGVFEGSIPSKRAENIDEERRILYVAITRAQALQYMSFPVLDRESLCNRVSHFLESPSIQCAFAKYGPECHERTLRMLCSILRREMPNREQILEGVRSLPSPHDRDDWFETNPRLHSENMKRSYSERGNGGYGGDNHLEAWDVEVGKHPSQKTFSRPQWPSAGLRPGNLPLPGFRSARTVLSNMDSYGQNGRKPTGKCGTDATKKSKHGSATNLATWLKPKQERRELPLPSAVEIDDRVFTPFKPPARSSVYRSSSAPTGGSTGGPSASALASASTSTSSASSKNASTEIVKRKRLGMCRRKQT